MIRYPVYMHLYHSPIIISPHDLLRNDASTKTCTHLPTATISSIRPIRIIFTVAARIHSQIVDRIETVSRRESSVEDGEERCRRS